VQHDLVNIIEMSMWCGSMAFLSNYFDQLLLGCIAASHAAYATDGVQQSFCHDRELFKNS